MSYIDQYTSIRQKIAKLLEDTETPLTVEEIARIFDLDKYDVYNHLSHIAKTVKALSKGKKVLFMIPPQCRKCGYIFKDLDKPKKPSKCPKCKSERIESPKFIVRNVT